ncbi:TPA: N-acetylmuramoyl-L-alanine amidase [Streptococcus suis]
MVKKINATLMNAGPLSSILGVVIHNDAGSRTPEQYVKWLGPRNKVLGIAHYYITREAIARVLNTNEVGYHTGDYYGNTHYIGYEVCQSISATDDEFLANEDMTLMQATEDLIYYGLPINADTVRLHHEFVPTSCPHRSLALHGNTTSSVKDHFIKRMQYFASLGKTVDEMLAKVNEQIKSGDQQPKPVATPTSIPTQTLQSTEEEDMTMTFVRIEEDLNTKVKKDSIYLFNAGARTYKHLNINQYNAAKAAYPHALMLKATKSANYFTLLIQALGASEI